MKKIGLFSLILIFIVILATGCSIAQDNLTNTKSLSASSSEFSVTLIGAETSRGHIDIDELLVNAATITFVDNDNSSDLSTANWVIGGTNTFVFTTDSTGLHTITVTESDEGGNSNTFSSSVNVRTGYNYSVTITLGGNIYVNVVGSDAIPTYSKLDCTEPGNGGGGFNVRYNYNDGSYQDVSHALFSANNQIELNSSDIDSIVSLGGGGGGSSTAVHTLSFLQGPNETIVTTFNSTGAPSSGTTMWHD